LIELLNRYIFNLETFHNFFYFLGTPAGELLKRSIELIFFTIIIYMIVSEFKRNKKRRYKYIIIGFFSLFFRQFIMSMILFSQIFGIYKFDRFGIAIFYVDNFLESIALILLVSSFIFPAFKDITKKYQKTVLVSLYFVVIISLLSYLFYKTGIINYKFSYVVMLLIKIIILLSPFYMLHHGKSWRITHRFSILLGFFIYLLTPLLYFISMIIYGYVEPKIIVSQQPLPFIALLLLMRSVYLTLVDKAFLKTRLKKSEEEVKHEKEMSKLKDYFISLVSHELRTPITSMKLYLSLMEKKQFGELTSKQKKALNTIINENNRLGDLINDLLTINKMESKKIYLNITDFDLNEILDKLYFNLAKQNGITVKNKTPIRFDVSGDKVRLKQVFVNLMNNAIKFSEKGTTIELSCGKNKKEWHFSVKDGGVGIPEEEIPKLFDKFYQVENVVIRKTQGIGLGLSIVKHIVDRHGGKVEIVSDMGKGTTFTVRIPFQNNNGK